MTETSVIDHIEQHDMRKVELEALLRQARAWNGAVTGMTIGGGPFNTEVSRLLLAAHIQLLETLVEGKPMTKLPSRHHA